MNTSELQCCIDCDYTLKGHVNVYAADYLLELIDPLPCGIIVNADVHYKPGTHWCAIFFDEKGNNYFFDSFGYPPEHYGYFIRSFLKQNHRGSLTVNSKRSSSKISWSPYE